MPHGAPNRQRQRARPTITEGTPLAGGRHPSGSEPAHPVPLQASALAAAPCRPIPEPFVRSGPCEPACIDLIAVNAERVAAQDRDTSTARSGSGTFRNVEMRCWSRMRCPPASSTRVPSTRISDRPSTSMPSADPPFQRSCARTFESALPTLLARELRFLLAGPDAGSSDSRDGRGPVPREAHPGIVGAPGARHAARARRPGALGDVRRERGGRERTRAIVAGLLRSGIEVAWYVGSRGWRARPSSVPIGRDGHVDAASQNGSSRSVEVPQVFCEPSGTGVDVSTTLLP